ncbi:helix-turn-helix transcriptional regulator [Phycisphaerales bacterium AB-hyl4]|uniref:Helix-turn-helix transcriptional regulator n=1 Tax=Natronomicrosphaera hydrolytica TaxID=3242702 RepID=A0ABV4U5A2_9BACT
MNQLSERAVPLVGQMIDAFLAQDVVTCSITLAQILTDIANRPIDVPLKKLSLAVADTLRWINDPSTYGMGIKTIAQKLEMSPSNLRRVFRSEMGVSLGQYIRNHRMGMAKHQLRRTNLSIGQIAIHCGYSSIYAFSHAFKGVVGQSPNQYRQQHIEADADPAKGIGHRRRASDT